MDVLFFLKERTTFIRYFYSSASAPFLETQRKIEEGVPPFDESPYEDGPPFEIEWQGAEVALQTLGRTCVSMLSATLKLYFETWASELQITWEPKERKGACKSGFINAYRQRFGEALKLSWGDCGVDFEILEQVVLARNRDQHPDRISRLSVDHLRADRQKHPLPFFISDTERKMFSDPEMANIPWMNPIVHVSRDALFQAIEQVEKLGEWLDERMVAAKYPRRC
jgi:hypothetical protein